MSEEKRIEALHQRTMPGHWDIHYQYSVGDTAAAFFQALQDDERILGSRCNHCARVLVPARSFCERCFEKTSELVAVGPQGIVQTFTRPATPVQARSDSFTILGMILLDDADTGITHFIGEIDDSDSEGLFELVKRGLRVEARFRPPTERIGGILDIAYFRPVDPEQRA